MQWVSGGERPGAWRVRAAMRIGRVLILPLVVTLPLLAALGLVAPIAAQERPQPVRVWTSIGLGGAAAKGLRADGGIAWQLVGQWDVHQVMLRTMYVGDIGSIPDGSGDSVVEAGILYGRRVTASFGYAGVAAGLSAVSADGLPGSAGEERGGVGIPVLAEAALQTTPVGLGLQLFGNLNSVASFGGMAIMVYLGWMP